MRVKAPPQCGNLRRNALKPLPFSATMTVAFREIGGRVVAGCVTGRAARGPSHASSGSEEYPLKTDDRRALPEVLGPFRVLHEIGVGTLGPVLRAYEPAHDRLVAIKLFHLDLDPTRLAQLVNRLQQLVDGHVMDPAIPTPLSAGSVNGVAYLAQTFVAGTSADAVLKAHGPMPPAHVVRAATAVAHALAGTTHGALHPRDLVMAPDRVWVTGCGIAAVIAAVGIKPPVRQPYAAPERAHGGSIDSRTDVFGLAAIVTQLMTGAPPAADLARAFERLPDPAGVYRAALVRVLARAMAPRPEDRFATTTELACELGRALTGPDQPHDRVKDALTTPDRLALPLGLSVLEPPRAEVDIQVIGASQLALNEVPPLALDLASPSTDIGDVLLRPAMEESTEDLFGSADVPAFAQTTGSVDRVAERGIAPHELSQPGLLESSTAPVAPAVAMSGVPESAPPARDTVASRPVLTMPAGDASQSALWPLSLALVVGLVVGAAVGFIAFITRSTGETSIASTAPTPPTAPASVPAAPPTGLAADLATRRHSTDISPVGTGVGRADGLEPTDGRARGTRQPEMMPNTRAASRMIGRPNLDAGRAAGTSPVGLGGDGRGDATGRVLVRSLPTGARVFLDGKEMGVTPLPLRSIPFGGHRVRVLREGYEAVDSDVTLTPARPSDSLIVDLKPRSGTVTASTSSNGAPAVAAETPTAGLVVESRPPGATVFLNDRRLGTTPLTMDAVASGVYAIRLELDGYRQWSSSVRVAPGERSRIAASLEH